MGVAAHRAAVRTRIATASERERDRAPGASLSPRKTPRASDFATHGHSERLAIRRFGVMPRAPPGPTAWADLVRCAAGYGGSLFHGVDFAIRSEQRDVLSELLQHDPAHKLRQDVAGVCGMRSPSHGCRLHLRATVRALVGGGTSAFHGNNLGVKQML